MPSATSITQLPKQQTAIVARGPGKLAIKHDAVMPTLRPDMAIVKTAAVAINPSDAKILDYSATANAIVGYDFAGTIVALGEDAPAHLSVGDRVGGIVLGMNKLEPDIGAFAEYVGARSDFLLKLPDAMSFAEGASLGTGVGTALLSLFYEMKVPLSMEQLAQGDAPVGVFVLVAGGATASGTRAIQLLKRAGHRPIATSSTSNFDLVTRFGAEKVFDYHDPTCAADIRAYTKNELAYALDCISHTDTTQLCYESIGRAGGRYVALEPVPETVAQTRPLTVEASWILTHTIFGGKVALDGAYGWEADPAKRTYIAKGFTAVQALMDRGLIDAHPVKVMPGGWEGVVKGVDIIRGQTMSGYKLVYPIA